MVYFCQPSAERLVSKSITDSTTYDMRIDCQYALPAEVYFQTAIHLFRKGPSASRVLTLCCGRCGQGPSFWAPWTLMLVLLLPWIRTRSTVRDPMLSSIRSRSSFLRCSSTVLLSRIPAAFRAVAGSSPITIGNKKKINKFFRRLFSSSQSQEKRNALPSHHSPCHPPPSHRHCRRPTTWPPSCAEVAHPASFSP